MRLPGGVFKPYAGVSTAILLFTKTNSGGTDHVWFYDVDADGMSLDYFLESFPTVRRQQAVAIIRHGLHQIERELA